MIRISELRLNPGQPDSALYAQAARRCGVKEISSLTVVKKSLDARDKNDIHYTVTADVAVPNEAQALKRAKKAVPAPVEKDCLPPRPCRFAFSPVIVGAGPAGLFAALYLARCGAAPILIERGRAVEERARDIDRFFDTAALDEDSNVQFGEGGAGTFSDGKLTTGIKSPFARDVLRTFVEMGAPEDILYLAKPHIGTDRLKTVVANMRRQILALGGRVMFSTRLTGLITEQGAVRGVTLSDGSSIRTDTVLLAIGHSARDTFRMLDDMGVLMERKPFAMGVRIEHLQEKISLAQYGKDAALLPPADYKLNVHTPDGRGVYTFCMCPGGYVMGATSLTGHVVTNGMSLYARDGVNANAALLCGVRAEDFPGEGVLAGVDLQEQWEKAAFTTGGESYRAPCQRVEDFLAKRPSQSPGEVMPTYRPGVTMTGLDGCLPGFIADDLRYALPILGRQLKGFDHPDALLTGIESRTSSPVRILRNENGESSLSGLYPVGEGAGYAGGIMSAACDGLAMAEKAMNQTVK